MKPAPLTLCEREQPWVFTATPLVHELCGSREHDDLVKRAICINKSVEIREAFSFASPVENLSAIKTCSASFYGCLL